MGPFGLSCILLPGDECPEPTETIHERQRQAETLDGLFALHGQRGRPQAPPNAPRLLRLIAIVNRFASELSFPPIVFALDATMGSTLD